MSAVEIVREFLNTIEEIHPRIVEDLGLDPRIEALPQLLQASRGKNARLPREGRTASGVGYSVHGYGCRFALEDGAVVDFDVANEGGITSDAWKVQQFAISRGRDLSLAELNEAIQASHERGLVENLREHACVHFNIRKTRWKGRRKLGWWQRSR